MNGGPPATGSPPPTTTGTATDLGCERTDPSRHHLGPDERAALRGRRLHHRQRRHHTATGSPRCRRPPRSATSWTRTSPAPSTRSRSTPRTAISTPPGRSPPSAADAQPHRRGLVDHGSACRLEPEPQQHRPGARAQRQPGHRRWRLQPDRATRATAVGSNLGPAPVNQPLGYKTAVAHGHRRDRCERLRGGDLGQPRSISAATSPP